jgi:hypothetical protein
VHLKRCNLTGCRVKSRLNYCTPGSQLHLDPYEDEHRCYQHTEIFKLITTPVLHKRFKYKQQSSNAQRKFKTEFEIQYDSYDDDKRWAPHPAHRCDANLPNLHGEDGAHSTVHPGGSGCPIQDAQISSKSAGTQPAQKGYNNNPEYTNTQQGLPDSGYT